MLRSTAIFAMLVLVGCNSPTTSQTNEPTPDNSERPPDMPGPTSSETFDGSDLPHASRAIALVQHLSEKHYRLANHPDEPVVRFDQQHVAAFLRTGELPERKELIRADNFSWYIDARLPRADPAVPDTPWYYDQSYLRGEWAKPFSSEVLLEMKTEWKEISVAFGPELHDAGRKLLSIAAIVLASPEKYKATAYIDIRPYEARRVAEFLAFADGY